MPIRTKASAKPETIEQLKPFIGELSAIAGRSTYDSPETAINLPLDEDLARGVADAAAPFHTPELRHIVVVGIGGSNLGAKAIYDALYGSFDVLKPDRAPKIYFADTVDSEYLAALREHLAEKTERPEQILICVISKSGTTVETTTNAKYLATVLAPTLGALEHRTVVISSTSDTLPIPEQISGRFSVLTSAGLFPLACVDHDIVPALRRGARDMRTRCLNEDMGENPAVNLAAAAFDAYASGIFAHDYFFFHPELESLGKWTRQLIGESLGKNDKGILPTISIGSTDLHSVAQLYLGGPRMTHFTFVRTTTLHPVTDAIYRASTDAFRERGLTVSEIELPDVSPASLGEFMQLQMMETMCLASLMGVNAFDQPNVELYKRKMREILTQP